MSRLPSQEQSFSGSLGVKAERRNLTVVFCDMVGSTELSNRLDPEDMRDIIRAFQRCAEIAILGLDGRIGRYMGDGILAYFGFPAAHEDSAERAVQAAMEVIRLVSELSFEGVPRIEVRIGIATGLVVVGDLIGEGANREFALIGDAPIWRPVCNNWQNLIRLWWRQVRGFCWAIFSNSKISAIKT